MKKQVKISNICIVVFIVCFFVCAYFLGFECVFKKYLHIICPGCGMTRAVKALVHLDFASAFFYHPMVFSMPLVFVYILKNGRLFKKKHVDNVVLGTIGLGFVINYVINLMRFFT